MAPFCDWENPDYKSDTELEEAGSSREYEENSTDESDDDSLEDIWCYTGPLLKDPSPPADTRPETHSEFLRVIILSAVSDPSAVSHEENSLGKYNDPASEDCETPTHSNSSRNRKRSRGWDDINSTDFYSGLRFEGSRVPFRPRRTDKLPVIKDEREYNEHFPELRATSEPNEAYLADENEGSTRRVNADRKRKHSEYLRNRVRVPLSILDPRPAYLCEENAPGASSDLTLEQWWLLEDIEWHSDSDSDYDDALPYL